MLSTATRPDDEGLMDEARDIAAFKVSSLTMRIVALPLAVTLGQDDALSGGRVSK
jgi:hypothetical protein